MPAIQTTYEQYHDSWQLGQVADTTAAVIVSRLVESDGGVGFGRPVFAGSADRSCVVAATGFDITKFQGITAGDIFGDPALIVNGQSVDAYPQGSEAKVLKTGAVVVTVSADVVYGDPVALDANGNFVAASATGATTIPRATYLASAKSGTLVPVEIR